MTAITTNLQLKPIRKKVENPKLLHYLPRWQSNNSPSDLGIIRFGFELFPSALKREYGVAGWVRPALYEVLAYENGYTKLDMCHAICTYREGAKSTWFGKVLPLYLMLVGQYGIYHKDTLLPEFDFIRLRAKTGLEAEHRLTRISMEFNEERIIELFGRLEPTLKEIKNDKLKNNARFIILRNGYIFQALGLDQPARGANIKDRRPKFDIDDDVENKDNTKTHTAREYNSTEILGEQFGGLDKEGITVYIGNYVHRECIMRYLQEDDNTGWKKQFHTLTYYDKDGVEHADWEKRFPLKYARALEKWYIKQKKLGGVRTFYLEYYNRIVSEQSVEIKWYEGRYVRKNGYNWLVRERNVEGMPREIWTNVYVVISLDPAISTSKESSDGCVTVTFFASDGKRYLHELSLGKFDIRDRYYDWTKAPRIVAINGEELANVRMRGSVDEVIRYIIKYYADAFVVEVGGQQGAWLTDIKDLLNRLGISIPGLPYKPTEDKDYKLITGLFNHFANDEYRFNKNMRHKEQVRIQIETFSPNSGKKDILDSMHNAEKMGRIPEKVGSDTYGDIDRDRHITEVTKIINTPGVEAWAVLP